jgi:hypothetical protein
VAARVLSRENAPELDEAVARLVQAGAGTLDGLVFFGSRRTGAARANAWSAYDVFVLVPTYRPFYQAMRNAGMSGKGPGFMALISHWLPPTQYSIRIEGSPVHLKGAVIRTSTFHRETSPRRVDHFCAGRLFQPSRILYARTDAIQDALVDDLVSAHAETWDWSRPWLPARFDADAYGRGALAVSMSWEVRPEAPGRAAALWDAQKGEQAPVFEALLASLAARGRIAPAGGGEWAPTRPADDLETFRWTWYFRRSIFRSTIRWLKHVMSFEGWLDYLLRKASRHSGEEVRLSERERRWPLVFLWPRVFRHLRAKQQKGRPA